MDHNPYDKKRSISIDESNKKKLGEEELEKLCECVYDDDLKSILFSYFRHSNQMESYGKAVIDGVRLPAPINFTNNDPPQVLIAELLNEYMVSQENMLLYYPVQLSEIGQLYNYDLYLPSEKKANDLLFTHYLKNYKKCLDYLATMKQNRSRYRTLEIMRLSADTKLVNYDTAKKNLLEDNFKKRKLADSNYFQMMMREADRITILSNQLTVDDVPSSALSSPTKRE
ncbi:hypothetical protein SNEBB_010226 [Seison nebaliae]|nr:hypothetical protein SNEBB_010226 [Seison nebaliae]